MQLVILQKQTVPQSPGALGGGTAARGGRMTTASASLLLKYWSFWGGARQHSKERNFVFQVILLSIPSCSVAFGYGAERLAAGSWSRRVTWVMTSSTWMTSRQAVSTAISLCDSCC